MTGSCVPPHGPSLRRGVSHHVCMEVPVLGWSGAVEGVVRWFNPEKGFGFLVTEQLPDEVFVHYSAVAGDGWRTLRAGVRVRFQLELGPRGPRAACVQVLAPPADPL